MKKIFEIPNGYVISNCTQLDSKRIEVDCAETWENGDFVIGYTWDGHKYIAIVKELNTSRDNIKFHAFMLLGGFEHGVVSFNQNSSISRIAGRACVNEINFFETQLTKKGVKWNEFNKKIEKIRWRAAYGDQYWTTMCDFRDNTLYVPITYADKRQTYENNAYLAGDYFKTEEECQIVCDEMNAVLQKRLK